jgi:hypothetical protein
MALWSTKVGYLKMRGSGLLTQVSEDGSEIVSGDTIDSLAEMINRPFDRMKMDIEGSEVEALKGAENTLPSVQQTVIEVHGQKNLVSAETLLRTRGFKTHLLPSESLIDAMKETVRHPFLTLALEESNGFHTSSRLVMEAARRLLRNQKIQPPNTWLLHATR